MQNIVAKFVDLKRRVGGNREIREFEYSFGMPREEQALITMPNKWNRRIISELDFAIKLSSVNEGRFDTALNNALDYLKEAMDLEGALTTSACTNAEKMLAPIAAAAKEYKLILAAHAHLDMNWMWSFNETVAITLATFRTILSIMEQYPDFCFSQSQASVYKIVEDYDPELMDKIKARIKEGRWEISATAWVETDKNMPNTESLLRHIKYTRDYLQEKWDIDPNSLELDFSPDTFGHNANVPEINFHGNVKYYYHCRALDGGNALYRWKAPSGKEILVYREQYWYNSAITPHIGAGLIDISKRCAGFKTGLIVYGVGDHGGGPTRKDVERAIEMSEWPIYPTIKFGTIREFFKEAEAIKASLPLVDHELNYFAAGCYTTQSRIKLGNRRTETALINAEALSIFANSLAGFTFQKEQFVRAWRDVLFTHFHDILTGSCVQDSREHAMGLYQTSMAVANTNYQNAMREIARNIDTSSIKEDIDCYAQSYGGGVGFGLENFSGVPNTELGSGKTRIFHIFNPTAAQRKQPIEITVWDWVGDMRHIQMQKPDGTAVEFQLLNTSLQHYWDHKYFKLLADVTVPPLGYTTIVLRESEPTDYPVYYHPEKRSAYAYDDFVLENEYICAKFHRTNGCMFSLVDKRTQLEYIKQGDVASFNFIESEKATSSGWDIGKHLLTMPVTHSVDIKSTVSGELQNGFTVKYTIKSSTITVNVTLDKHAKAVQYSTIVDWNEIGGETVPVLNFSVPVAYKTDSYRYDIPAGSIVRKGMELDVPGLQYGCAVSPTDDSVVVVTDSKYGYRGIDNTISTTLINSATNPDPYPERGIHHINIAVGISKSCPKVLEDFATAINHKLSFHSSNSHKGKLPLEHSLFAFEGGTAVVSAVTQSNRGDILVRLYETCGKSTVVEMEFYKEVLSAKFVNLMEANLDGDININGNKITLTVEANTIATIAIETSKN